MTLLDLPQVPLTLTHTRTGQSEVLSVTGYLDQYTVPLLQPALLAAAESLGHPKSGSLTVDLSCARYVDRAGMEMLLRVRETVASRDCTLVIRLRPGSQPESLFHGGNPDSLLTATYDSAK